ncbi:MAG: VWA domain-containing protein [Pirellulaceae bacterium]|nr:VWA domain-containing protein [Pirellulaceae bacterium]
MKTTSLTKRTVPSKSTNANPRQRRWLESSGSSWVWILILLSVSSLALVDRYRLNHVIDQQVTRLHEVESEFQANQAKLAKTLSTISASAAEVERIQNLHLKRLQDFARFVDEDPAMQRRILEEALSFAKIAKISTESVDEPIAKLPISTALAPNCKVSILSANQTRSIATVDISVNKQSGEFVEGLSRVDFVAECQNRNIYPVRVEQTSASIGTLSLSILLDCSSSVAGPDFEKLKEACTALVKQTANPWKVRIVRFASDVKAISPRSHDQDVHIEAIAALSADGATQMNEALRFDAQEQVRLTGRKVTILFTDGIDSSNRIDIEHTLQLYREAQCQVHVVGLDRGQIDEPSLRLIATETGGSFQTIADANQLAATFTAIADRMKAPVYRLTMLTPIELKGFKLAVGGLPSIEVKTEQLIAKKR